jgi:isocitrate dehydrogenase
MEQKITWQNNKLNVPDNPVIPFIEGGFKTWGYALA